MSSLSSKKKFLNFTDFFFWEVTQDSPKNNHRRRVQSTWCTTSPRNRQNENETEKILMLNVIKMKGRVKRFAVFRGLWMCLKQLRRCELTATYNKRATFLARNYVECVHNWWSIRESRKNQHYVNSLTFWDRGEDQRRLESSRLEQELFFSRAKYFLKTTFNWHCI